MTSKMYAAILVYESSGSAADYEPLYQETVILIRGNSEQEAAEKAHNFGRTAFPRL